MLKTVSKWDLSLVKFSVAVATRLKKQVYHVKTELVKRLQRQRHHYFATGLCGTMCAHRW